LHDEETVEPTTAHLASRKALDRILLMVAITAARPTLVLRLPR
jgi:hypothetical protein